MTKKELLEQVRQLNDPNYEIPEMSFEELEALDRRIRTYSLLYSQLNTQYSLLELQNRMEDAVAAEENV